MTINCFISLAISLLFLSTPAWTSTTPQAIFPYYKFVGDQMAINLSYPGVRDGGDPVLVQMGSVETWLALADCTADACQIIDPKYEAYPLYPEYFYAHYKCPVVGYGKPIVQTIVNDPAITLPFKFQQVLLAVEHVNKDFPLKYTPKGVAGLGPICSESYLVSQFDTPQYSASILQNLFRMRFTGGKQEFFFRRSPQKWGTLLTDASNFYQNQSQEPRSNLIPVIPDACSWAFSLSSDIVVFRGNSTLHAPYRYVPRPCYINMDQTYDFNMVSAEMAISYAESFNSINQHLNVSAKAEERGDLIVFKYAQDGFNLTFVPSFPAISFHALNIDGVDTRFAFSGVQGVLSQVAGTVLFEYFLPFAYFKGAPCTEGWILGYPFINDGAVPNQFYNYPKTVVSGTTDGITQYSIALKAQ